MNNYEADYPHLDFDTDTGWGYLPPTEPIMDCMQYIQQNCNPKNILEVGYYLRTLDIISRTS